MQVGEPLNGIGEGLLIDLGVLGADAVADGRISEPSSAVRLRFDLDADPISLRAGRDFFCKTTPRVP
jgi:hypothetical protein